MNTRADAFSGSTLNRIYPDGTAALRGATFTISDGEFISLTGHSGSGKSTLLNILGLLDQPSSGELLIYGQDCSSQNNRQLSKIRSEFLGFVFQSFHLIDHRTVLENVQIGALYNNWDKKKRFAEAKRIIESFGLGDRMLSLPRTLSGGERQRVAIARALMGNPKILLCDEPTGNLDTMNSEVVLGHLQTLNDNGVTLIVVTHDTSIAKRGDRMLTMSDGVLNSGLV